MNRCVQRISMGLTLILFGCGSVGSGLGGDGQAADAGADGGQADGGPVGDNMGTVPSAPAQSGVVYVGHYLSSELAIYRLDGEVPRAVPAMELGEYTHDIALDADNDLMVVVHDVAKQAALYRLSRPAGPDDELVLPSKVATIEFSSTPVFAAVHPQRKHAYVIESPPAPGNGQPITEMLFHAYDVSNPAQPIELDGSPYSIPPTTSFAVDAARSVLFVVAMTEDTLHGYDLTEGGLEPLPGGPVDLLAMYPQDNNFAFQARNLTVDPWRNRLLAMRAQSALSELIAIEYPADVPRGGASYGDFAAMDQLTVIPDALAVDQPPDERQNLLGAYQVGVEPDTGAVFASTDAWNGSSATALAAAFAPDLSQLASGCGDFEGFGCFYRNYADGEPAGFLRTDGAMCLDATHKVMVATTVASPEDDPGSALFFRYQDDLAMSPWLSDDGGNLAAGALPIAAVCH